MKTRFLSTAGFVVLLSVGAVGADEPAMVHIVVAGDKIDFLVGKDLAGRYHYGPEVAKPYLWPVNGPGGREMTRAWPMRKAPPGGSTDHIHQKSVWFCHGDVLREGLESEDKGKGPKGIDFWMEAAGHGQIACVQVDKPSHRKNHGQVKTRNEWRISDIAILVEDRIIHLYDFGDTRLFVFDIDLLAGAAPVTFGDTKEGSFGVRVSDQIREQTGKGILENAEGKTGEKNCWGQLSRWCDYSGTIDGMKVGIAVFDDPANPHPACWHCRGYGLMAANPFGRAKSGFPAMKGREDLVKLAQGEHLKLRYGLLTHPGDAKEGKVAEYYERFAKLRE